MSYDFSSKKTVVVLSSELDSGTAVNVACHLTLGLGHRLPATEMGRPNLSDASGCVHRGISKYPIIITVARPARLRKFIEQARLVPELCLCDYPRQMHTTRHDDELADAIAQVQEQQIIYYGAAAFGDTTTLNELAGRFTLWKGGKDP